MSLFKVVDGLRERIGKSLFINAPIERWHTLRVEYSGNTLDVRFNGKKVISVTDDTITRAGAMGLWTKTDAITLYDNFSYGGQLQRLSAKPGRKQERW